MEIVNTPPKPETYFESMQNVGYTLESAISDILDNSISSLATEIKILANHTPFFSIGILDNGRGMTKEELHESMRHGSKDPREKREDYDLGRFGYGLKLASMSQCQKLTVVTKKNDRINLAIWDKKIIEEKGSWALQESNKQEEIENITYFNEFTKDAKKSGTLVLWENFHHNFDQSEFNEKLNYSRKHIELIFHKFLSGSDKKEKIKISLNEEPLTPLDPFNSNHTATQIEETEIINENENFTVYTLPERSKYKNENEWEKYSLNEGYLKNQGLYIYREKRLIIYGTWLQLGKQTEMNKLTRVMVNITNKVDREWKINLQKNSAHLPQRVRNRFRPLLQSRSIGRGSHRIFRGQRDRTLNDESFWERNVRENIISYKINTRNRIITEFINSLDSNQKEEAKNLLTYISKSYPMEGIYADFGEERQILRHDIDPEVLKSLAVRTYNNLIKSNDLDRVKTIMEYMAPFNHNWEKTKEILNWKNVDNN